MNKIILMGRLTKDPEIKYSQGEKPVAIGRFSVAVNKKYKREGGPTADFFNCTAFGRQAEFIEKYLKKGSKVLITARLENNNYEKDGKTVYDNAIIVEEIEFALQRLKVGDMVKVRRKVEKRLDKYQIVVSNIDKL